ncbi:MAG: SDR family oxidoreductase [Deltaproteobacteria bacterium]|nr:SDR family oxidoreductase [Deltaproteobacteria bacterium]
MTERHVFITGYPGFIADRLVKKLLVTDDTLRVTVLAEASKKKLAEERIAALTLSGPGLANRVRLFFGDVTAMDLGLSGPEYSALISDATEVYHLAAVHSFGVSRAIAEAVNVTGTRNVLELARAVGKLDRLVHFSSAYVSGDRRGVILEDELDEGQGFRNPYEATKAAAERLVEAAKKRLPVIILRPPAVVGDSKTGEIDRLEGVYHAALLLLGAPTGLPIPFPGEGAAPLNMIPVDYLVDATCALATSPTTIGKTFHVVDPNPLSARRVYKALAESAGRRESKMRVSPNLTKALLRIPGLERYASSSHQVIDYLNHMAFYNSRNTIDALYGTGIRCPPFPSYVGALVRYVREYFEKARSTS